MSAMKPDYFIAYNGLPSILSTHSRQVITTKCDRVSNSSQQQIRPPAKNKRLSGANQQALLQRRDSEKNAKNEAIKESLRDMKSQKDLINSRIATSRQTCALSATNCANVDNRDCSRTANRTTKIPSIDFRDNKLMQQRKYDNTIFRHDLPDRIVLPPLPV